MSTVVHASGCAPLLLYVLLYGFDTCASRQLGQTPQLRSPYRHWGPFVSIEIAPAWISHLRLRGFADSTEFCGTLCYMDVWVTLLATVAGAVIALTGQYIVKRGEKRTRSGELLLEQCAQVIALSEDLRNRVWEEKELGVQGTVEAWDLGAHRLAAARVKF